MPRPTSEVLTKREAEIMDAIWNLGDATAEQIRERLRGNPHDSSVRTILRVLKRKGYVRVRGRQPQVYRAAMPRARVQQKAAKTLLQRFFGGSAEALVMRLLDDEDLTPEMLDALRSSKTTRSEGGES